MRGSDEDDEDADEDGDMIVQSQATFNIPEIRQIKYNSERRNLQYSLYYNIEGGSTSKTCRLQFTYTVVHILCNSLTHCSPSRIVL